MRKALKLGLGATLALAAVVLIGCSDQPAQAQTAPPDYPVVHADQFKVVVHPSNGTNLSIYDFRNAHGAPCTYVKPTSSSQSGSLSCDWSKAR